MRARDVDDVARMHAANGRHWDGAADKWRVIIDTDGIWPSLPERPDLAFEGNAFELIKQSRPSLDGAKVCVIGSGDNYAVFALAACGARVTSVDISQRQLDVAADRARQLRLAVDFVCCDAADLTSALLPDSFDLVVSTNGLFVWIADVGRVVTGIWRILRTEGVYVFFDVHPFQRPFTRDGSNLAITKPYRDSGPIEDPDGTYEFHWTVGALLTGLVSTGFTLDAVVESAPRNTSYWDDGHWDYLPGDPDLADWKLNPLAALPAWLTVAAAKRGDRAVPAQMASRT